MKIFAETEINSQSFEAGSSILETETSWLKTAFSALVLPTAICLGGMTLFWSLPANAQSFSCAMAAQPAEFAICNDENLVILDEKLGEVFASKFINASTSPARQAVTKEHNEWMKQRNACGTDFTCLNLKYQDRIKVLSSRSS